MSSEHDHNLIATLADYFWALILLIVGASARWIYNHEQRVTRLEAQSEECKHAQERHEKALRDLNVEIRGVNAKLDRILGFCSGRNRDA